MAGRKAEMERWKEEAKQEESKSGKKGERMEIKSRCLNRVFGDFFLRMSVTWLMR